MSNKFFMSLVFLLGLCGMNTQAAEHYTIDTTGMHAFITFRIQHLGYSWLEGRFNHFSGEFDYDEANPSSNRVEVEIEVKSVDTNNAERDKHLRSERFFDTGKFPTAAFVSTAWEDHGNGKATLRGEFTLRGVTKDISIDVTEIGGGKDPWGGFRRGFEGTTTLHLSDYNMKEGSILGAAAENVEIWISVEGVRK